MTESQNVNPERLRPALLSLVQHVELNNAGWWERAVTNMILAVLSEGTTEADIATIQDKLVDSFGFRIDISQLEFILRELRKAGHIVGQQQLKLSESFRLSMSREMNVFRRLAQASERRFVEVLKQSCPGIPTPGAWSRFINGVLTPLVRQLGARAYELMLGKTAYVDTDGLIDRFIDGYEAKWREPLRVALVQFLSPSDLDVRSYLLRHLNARLYVEAGYLDKKDLRIDRDGHRCEAIVPGICRYEFCRVDARVERTSCQRVE